MIRMPKTPEELQTFLLMCRLWEGCVFIAKWFVIAGICVGVAKCAGAF